MNSSTYQLAATMVNQFSRVDMISNNIANVNTNGFKQENLVEGSFNNYLNRAKNDGSNLDEMNKLVNTIPKIDGKFIMGQQGDLQMTRTDKNNKLDQALDNLILESGDTKSILSEGGLLKQLTKRLVERALESEMENHLGYTKYNHSNSDNARNGYNTKHLITENGTPKGI